MRLSVCVIVRNEEKNLPRVLASVAGVADEIVLVDTGSTDKTVAMAEEAGDRVFHFLWADDFLSPATPPLTMPACCGTIG